MFFLYCSDKHHPVQIRFKNSFQTRNRLNITIVDIKITTDDTKRANISVRENSIQVENHIFDINSQMFVSLKQNHIIL